MYLKYIIFSIALGFSLHLEYRDYYDTKSCEEYQYFDRIYLSCLNCSLNKVSYKKIDPYSCTCHSGYKYLPLLDKCEKCPDFYVTSKDGRHCVKCSNDSLFNETLKTCNMHSGKSILQEKHINGSYYERIKCIQCSNDSFIDTKNNLCSTCPSSFILDKNKGCICPDNSHVLINDVCLLQSELSSIPLKESVYIINYEDGSAVESAVFKTFYLLSAHGCSFHKNITACQILSNLCVLRHYVYANLFSPCTYYRSTYSDSHINLPDYVPWLYYPKHEAVSYLYKTKITTGYSFVNDIYNNKINLVVAKYSFHGHLLDYGKFEEVIAICPEIKNKLEMALIFGMKFYSSCQISINSILKYYDTVFYEVFMKYLDEYDKEKIYAIPVLNKNYKENNEFINQGPMSGWQLTRRFFLFDSLSGKENMESDYNFPKKIIYAKVFEIEIRKQTKQLNITGLIYPPLIKLYYDEIEGNYENRIVSCSFHVTYIEDERIEEKFAVAVGVLCVVCTFYTIIQTWSWSKRNGVIGIDAVTLVHFLFYLCGNLSSVFFIAVYGSSFYWTLFFKGQSAVYLLLPNQEQENVIKIYLIIALLLKTIEIIYIIWSHVVVDVFFIDWEQPKTVNSLPHPRSKEKVCEQEVSIWRTYFIANEWNELQTYRRINVPFQLLGTLFVLKIVGFENFSSADPYFHLYQTDKSIPQSFVCHLAVTVTVYFILALLQWLFYSAVWERYIHNKLQQFIDLCSMSNISLFLFHQKYFGYYIHGRSAYGSADINLKSFCEQMKREEDDLCGQRGLEPSNECQTFYVFSSKRFREHFDLILQPFMKNRHFPLSHKSKLKLKELDNFQTYDTLKKFFIFYLQHGFPDLDFVIKERLFLENLLDVEFQEADEKCLFFRDFSNGFSKLLFYGNEISLIVFEVLLFLCFDLYKFNSVFAVTLTYIVVIIIRNIRCFFGKKNVVNKTLVDSRFLN